MLIDPNESVEKKIDTILKFCSSIKIIPYNELTLYKIED